MRGLIVVVLLVGGWLGWIVRSARIQREAVAAIQRTGGIVLYNWNWENGKFVADGKPWAPKRLVNLFGVDCFGHVTRVSYLQRALDSLSAQEESLSAHIALKDAEIEKLRRGIITEAQPIQDDTPTMTENSAFMAYLTGLTELSQLDLQHNNVTDAGLAHLRGLTKLSSINLSHTKVTDAGMMHLKGLKALTNLNLSSTQVTDAGVKELLRARPTLTITR